MHSGKLELAYYKKCKLDIVTLVFEKHIDLRKMITGFIKTLFLFLYLFKVHLVNLHKMQRLP